MFQFLPSDKELFLSRFSLPRFPVLLSWIVPVRSTRTVCSLILFPLQNITLENLQRYTREITRGGTYYSASPGQTKIIHEIWGPCWYSNIMPPRSLKSLELIDYANHHPSTEDRWKKGAYELAQES